MDQNLVDVIMPDVKHVGGFGPLATISREAEKRGVQVSPHNPAGPIASAASLQAASLCGAITSIEIPLLSTGEIPVPGEWQRGNRLIIPNLPGWGISELDQDFAFERTGASASQASST